jgi:phosphopantothenoylcysteine synthetase/decarboxylase
MWTHPITRSSLEKLESLGVIVLQPGAGNLACGDIGEGRLMEPDEILAKILDR